MSHSTDKLYESLIKMKILLFFFKKKKKEGLTLMFLDRIDGIQ